jgi:hypothetical protein
MRAFVLIRHDPLYRRASFEQGLRAVGYEIHGIPRDTIKPSDVLVIWNRYGEGAIYADRFETAGARVLVAENGYLGRDWRGEHWYALAANYHNGAGSWPRGGAERWNDWRVPMAEWRTGGNEIVILATRSIGPVGVAEPHGWCGQQYDLLRRMTDRPVRIREHPGERPCVSLEHDLRDAYAVLTWGSGAALKALLMGIPVFYGFKNWIGAGAGRVWDGNLEPARPCRLNTFQTLAWSMWNTQEIATGEPFAQLLA